MIAYLATMYKLYRQSATVRPEPHVRLQTLGKKTKQQHEQQMTSAERKPTTSMHVRHVRALNIYMYTAILLQFAVVSLISTIGSKVPGLSWLSYVVYIKNIGNPVIYYCFVPKFREGVKASARALFGPKQSNGLNCLKFLDIDS